MTMPDRENVIKGLENLKETIRTATQYTFISGSICAMNMKRIDNALALLKEQEAVEPYCVNTNYEQHWKCGNCDYVLGVQDKYCRKCGRAVKWNTQQK
jgi:hypothetical protein